MPGDQNSCLGHVCFLFYPSSFPLLFHGHGRTRQDSGRRISVHTRLARPRAGATAAGVLPPSTPPRQTAPQPTTSAPDTTAGDLPPATSSVHAIRRHRQPHLRHTPSRAPSPHPAAPRALHLGGRPRPSLRRAGQAEEGRPDPNSLCSPHSHMLPPAAAMVGPLGSGLRGGCGWSPRRTHARCSRGSARHRGQHPGRPLPFLLLAFFFISIVLFFIQFLLLI